MYENQKQAAEEILYNYKSIRSGLLRANEQSGKTGTYHYLIHLMFDQHLIDRVYVLCGSHDTELRAQCIKDREWHNNSRREKIYVVFRQNFKNVPLNTNRALIIVDESHLVEGIDQSLSTYLATYHLTMAGQTPIMDRNSTYMLSVDATPYAEESAMMESTLFKKFKVTLKDGVDYFGVKEYYDAGLIHPTFDIASYRGKNSFTYLLQSYPRKYILIRIQEKRNKCVKWIKKWAQLTDCDIRYYTSKFTKQTKQICITRDEANTHFTDCYKNIPCLEDAPEKTTIVFIDGRLRCGKRVPKKHVGFIWEASKTAKTDVIRQSLLGRMSGYIGRSVCNDVCTCEGVCVYKVPETKPLIFIPGYLLKPAVHKVVPFCDLERTWQNPSNDQ
jgi:hypothetical protein